MDEPTMRTLLRDIRAFGSGVLLTMAQNGVAVKSGPPVATLA